VEHDSDDSRLIVLNVSSKESRRSQPLPESVSRLAFSPGASHLVYIDSARLMAYDHRSGAIDRLATAVLSHAYASYAFSPNGRALAVAERDGLKIVPADALPAVEPQRRYPWPVQCEFVDMKWLPDRAALAILCLVTPARRAYSLFLLDATSQTWGEHPASASGPKRLLGWRLAQDELVAVRARDDGEDEAIAIAANGDVRPFRTPAPEDEPSPESVLAFLAAPDRVVTAAPGEDQGDAAALSLVGPGPNDMQNWLTMYPRLTSLNFSADGSWAVFVNRRESDDDGLPGGEICLVRTGSEDAVIVLREVAGERAYTSPAIY
jgi:hypothetical protein